MLVDYKCKSNHVTEILVKRSERPDIIECECGQPATRQIALVAKTAGKWGDTGLGGTSVNGFYDRGLGASYSSSAERDRICKEKGVIPLSEFGTSDYIIEDHIEKQKRDAKANDAYCDTYDKVLQESGRMTKAHDAGLKAKEEI